MKLNFLLDESLESEFAELYLFAVEDLGCYFLPNPFLLKHSLQGEASHYPELLLHECHLFHEALDNGQSRTILY
jgi:hypothetical protein